MDFVKKLTKNNAWCMYIYKKKSFKTLAFMLIVSLFTDIC